MPVEIKVTEAVGTDEKTASTIDLLDGLDVSENTKKQIKRDVGDFLVESILSKLHSAKSPVSGEKFEKLSPEYAAKKKEEGLPAIPNMELEGDMLDSLTYKETDTGIELGFWGDQAGKADGHNNFSGKSQIPTRRFLPDAGDKFTNDIQNEIEKIVADAIADDVSFNKSDFNAVTTSVELYSVLREYFDGFSKAEIRAMAFRSPSIVDFLDSEGLLELL